MSTPEPLFRPRFTEYFEREVATRAAHSIANGAEIEFRITGSSEIFTFTKKGGQPELLPGPATDPQLIFSLTPGAAEKILSDASTRIGEIGVNIAKLIISNDPAVKVELKIKAGFLTLFNQGYFGVLKAGGAEFASFLASKGFNGIGAIKSALKKIRE